VTVTTESADQVAREVRGLRATAYDVPEGCCAGYYPECNPLIQWWHHAGGNKTPAAVVFFFLAGGDGDRRSPEHLARAGLRAHYRLGWFVLNLELSDY
jgi:hypothetical protein